VLQDGHPQTVALPAFRDALRNDAGPRGEYAGLKDRLAVQHPSNRNAYTKCQG
jgi:GrpB-like predicted nucleotidyltransferase (UPF0157 family)